MVDKVIVKGEVDEKYKDIVLNLLRADFKPRFADLSEKTGVSQQVLRKKYSEILEEYDLQLFIKVKANNLCNLCSERTVFKNDNCFKCYSKKVL